MPQFEFYLDRKVRQWYRETHHVEADSLEEARRKMIKIFLNNDDTEETFSWQETMDDTREDLIPEENNGNPTAELYCGESKMFLIDNVTKQ